MPGPDGEGHHGQLRQDQGGEADGHYVDKLVLKEQECPKHDYPSLVKGDQHPDEEGLVAKASSLRELLVQLWICDGYLPGHVPVIGKG